MTTTPSRYSAVPRAVAIPMRTGIATLDLIGHQLTFGAQVLIAIPKTLKHYRRQTRVALREVCWGDGSLVIGGGVVPVLVILGCVVGASIGVEGFTALRTVGLGPFSGFISAFANTREMGPMLAAIGFASQAGCRMTAEIGAMRISEEIDALEATAVQPIPFVVTTRVIAGVITIIPAYLITLILSWTACRVVVTWFHGQSTGTYDHYFTAFIHPADVAYSVLKTVVFIVVVILIHCYQGFYASGGPEGVGRASGRAIRASLVAIVAIDMVLTLVIWGFDPGVRISG